MKSDTPLDYAVLQLSPKCSRCELFVSRDGNTEKLASGLVKPFVSHLKVAEEKVRLSVQTIKLEAEKKKNAEMWFTKGTLERFVCFVSTPELLELVNTSDAEMSQLEAARKIYSQLGLEDQQSSTLGNGGTSVITTTDATKKELSRAIDVRLVAVRQDLTTACARAVAAGFNADTVSELQMFADCFGAHRLNEACSKFISLCERRMDLMKPLKAEVDEQAVRSSYGSDMSIDIDSTSSEPHATAMSIQKQHQQNVHGNKHLSILERDRTQQQYDEQSKHSTCDQPKVTFPLWCSRDSSDEKEDTHKENEEEEKTGENSGQDELPQISWPAKRLSVQDRINMFENKQKENSGSGGKTMVGKSTDFRRLSSDMSSAPCAAEKAVLRRWSCASDMSIDLSSDKKDVESPLSTSASASVSQVKLEQQEFNDTASSIKPKIKIIPGRVADDELKHQVSLEDEIEATSGREEVVGTKVEKKSAIPLFVSSSRLEGASDSSRSNSTSKTVDNDFQKDQTRIMFQSRSFFNNTKDSSSKDQATSQIQFPVGSRGEQIGFLDQGKVTSSIGMDDLGGSKEQVPTLAQIAGHEVQAIPQTQFSTSASKGHGITTTDESHQFPRVEFPKQVEDGGSKYEFISQLRSKAPLRVPMDSRRSDKEETEKKDNYFTKKQTSNSATKLEASGLPKMKFQKQVSSSELLNKSEGSSCSSTTTLPAQNLQRARQSKGNQELNDELKMKANELEKLFAEHKLRVPGDQSNSARRSKPTDMQIEQTASLSYRQQAGELTPPQIANKDAVTEPSGSSIMKTGASWDHTDTSTASFSELRFSEELRGKFYDRYMQKRDAKLREEWVSRSAEKEAKMKGMQDSFEKSRAEMMAKFSGSADKQDSVLSDRRRAESLRSFNTRPTMKREQPLDFVQSEDDGDLSIGDGIPRSIQSKRPPPSKNLSSSTPRASVAPVQRSAIRTSNSLPGRRRMPSENPLAQSVPNFSDLRKENTKPSSAESKMSSWQQMKTYSHSKSTSEEISFVKEEKAKRSQSFRKSAACPGEFKDMTPPNSEDILAPLKFDEEQSDQSLYDKYLKNVEPRSFLGKNNGMGPGSDAELLYKAENEVDLLNNDEQTAMSSTTNNDHSNVENGESRLNQKFEIFLNSGSENGESLGSFSKMDPSMTELPATVSPTFYPPGSVRDSPDESPMSWNSRMHHPFADQHETSDIDASVDSPIGSLASWNSHLFNQIDNDVAQMRKKWGSAQKPFLVANSSQNQSRKDVAKGFKRLLKFGRKSRGTENLADWISATTSEGDDDTEDGRDPASRSSEDLKKSRMGFSRDHPCDDSFNESEFFFSEQVETVHNSIPAPPANFKCREDHLSGSSMKGPKSFFSLSNFRSKGSDSKPR